MANTNKKERLIDRVNNVGDRWLYQKTRFGWVVIDSAGQFKVRGAFLTLEHAVAYVESTFNMEAIVAKRQEMESLLAAMGV